MLALDKAEAVVLAETVKVFEVAVCRPFLEKRRVSEDRVHMQDPTLLDLPDPNEQPRLQLFTDAPLIGRPMEGAPRFRRSFVPRCRLGDAYSASGRSGVPVLAEMSAMRVVPFHLVLPWGRHGRNQDLRRLHAVRHLVGVGVQIREQLLALIAGPERREAGAPAPAAAA
jgi:hypothetical protein